MSRSGYSDDIDYNELNLYRGNVERAMAGKRWQAFFRELLREMDAMSEKKLAAGLFEEGGEVCAIAVVGRARGIDMSKWSVDDGAYGIGRAFGIADMMAAEIMFMNDETYGDETDEQRWQRMRDWVVSKLHD